MLAAGALAAGVVVLSPEVAGVAVVVGADAAGVDWGVDEVAGVCALPDAASSVANRAAIPMWFRVRMRSLRRSALPAIRRCATLS